MNKTIQQGAREADVLTCSSMMFAPDMLRRVSIYLRTLQKLTDDEARVSLDATIRQAADLNSPDRHEADIALYFLRHTGVVR